ncbi:MAG: DUF4011 domain-containing protein [Anaeroplasmataceae bacterium]|nr:DUF4011 domain-containing protein [Anaeroplasmataceae bacterium]
MEQKLKDISLHLLDLGKRNRLINYKSSGLRTLDVYNENLDVLFEKITSGTQLSIFQIDPVLQKYYQTIDGTGNIVEEYSVGKVKDIVMPLLKANDLLCYKKGVPLQRVVKVLFREYKNTLIEKGINTLYMSFGMVEYIQKQERYLAPLLLIPIDLDINGFKVKSSEDEVVLNPTLAYLLENEYGVVLEEFKENDRTLTEYFSKTSYQLLEKGMRLELRISMGIYSFLKMNMFHDLQNNIDTILKNQNIMRLLGNADIPADELTHMPILPVVDADESQLEAIQAASDGASFVLQGPPGTGKSQTITNMIASFIGNGKKVLFVSEKQAALNVVYENLKRAGLDSFAVELHSHKANKKEFVEELYKTAILPKYDINHDAQDLKKRYDYLWTLLEEYRSKLHEPIPRLGMTLYEVYSAFLKVERMESLFKFESIETLQKNDLEEILACLNQYAITSKSLGYDYKQGPFYGLICKDTSYIRYEAKEDLEKLYQFYQALNQLREELTKAMPFQIESYKNIVDAMPCIDRILQLNYFLPQYFIKEEREKLCKRIKLYQETSKYLNKSSLKNFLDLKIIQIDGLEELVKLFDIERKRVFKFLMPSYHRIKKELAMYTKLKMKDEDLAFKLAEALEYKNKTKLLFKLKKHLPEQFRPFEYEVLYKDAESLSCLPFDLKIAEEKFDAFKRKLFDISRYFTKINTISLGLYVKRFDAEILHFIEGNIKEVSLKLKDMISSIDLLDVHAERLDILEKLKEHHMLNFLDQALEQKVSLNMLCSCFEQAFWQANILYEVNQNPVLQEFSSLSVQQILTDFKKLDQTHLETNKAYIVSKLSNYRPDDSIMVGSKFSLLVKEYNKSRKLKPIRLLLEEIFDLVLDIKPVFLMSPLSVSTYLNSKLHLFDAVIFDESSQVFAWDALGAIYRAKQCIIIGDSKQMPPSNFFTSTIEEEDDYENEMESILDRGTSVFPTKRLHWHYRSRSEELISFSNHHFYDDGLITIPQAKMHQKGFGVNFHYVMGTYEVKARTNQVEAAYVVDLVFEHIKNRPELSLGVVAFSNAQADLIADEIEARLEQEPSAKAFFEENQREPFFVKNLESVQGDERDVIIFSICFGYTKEHKFYQRFGPLNTAGGERRLNVAITRAKMNVCVVSSIYARDIHLDQTESIGVAMLKKYLEYAENASVPPHRFHQSEDGVIAAMERFLMKKGYTVQTKLGSSLFKIDLAVLDKETQEYRFAIMLDGASYRIGNCSDANALQERLLERLGWRFLRVFSTEWIMQEKLVQDQILQFLNEKQNKESLKTETKENFLIEIEDTFDESFLPYLEVPEEKLIELYHNKSPQAVIRYVIAKEEPIHIEYLLKRICFMYGRTKVTGLVREYFEKDMEDVELYRDGDFLSIHPITAMGLRIPSNRSIEYIHREELKDAIYKIIKKSNGITKEGCYKKVISLLGYNRMSERAVEILEEALVFLKLEGKVIEKQECLYV